MYLDQMVATLKKLDTRLLRADPSDSAVKT
jgi:hypothetical protein